MRIWRTAPPAAADNPGARQSPKRIVHVHIPKTAGSALSLAFRQAGGDQFRTYPERYEANFRSTDYADYDFFTGHIGFKVASEIGGDVITVLRDPVDRFLSTYYFLRQMYAVGQEISLKTSLAAQYDLNQFVKITDEPVLEHELRNRMAWQIAYSDRPELRRELIKAGVGDDQLVRMAVANLSTFAIVGYQTDMAGLAKAIRQRYGTKLSIARFNVTSSRMKSSDISPATRAQIERWVHLDQELWSAWIRAGQ